MEGGTPQPWGGEPSPAPLGAATRPAGEPVAPVPGEARRAPDNGTQLHFHFLMGELSADGAVNHSSVFPWPGGRAASQHRHSQPRRGGEAWLSLNTNVSRAAAALRPAPQAGRGPGETPQAAHHQGLPLQCWQPGGLQNEPAALARTTECWPCLAACPRGRLSLGISVCPWGWLFVSLFASCGEAGEPCRAPGRETRARGVSVPGGPRCPDCCWQPCLSAHPLPCLP